MKHHHRSQFPKPKSPKTTTTIYRGPKGTSVSTKTRSGGSTITTTRSANGKTRNTVSTKLGGVTQVRQSSGAKTRTWTQFTQRMGATIFKTRT